MKLLGIKSLCKRYWLVWKRMAILQFQANLIHTRKTAILFIFGKSFRFFSSFMIIAIIVQHTSALANYSFYQAIFIYALFNFFSTLAQLIFRSVYVFQNKVIDGSLDFFLLNPLNPLFFALFSYPDPLDFLMIIPYFGLVVWSFLSLGYILNLISLTYFFLFIILTFSFNFSLNTFIVALSIRYYQVDNLIMLYRDIEKTMALPIDIYGSKFSFIFSYLFPLGIMATIPAKIIFGLLNPLVIIYLSCLIMIFVFLALYFWKSTLKLYTSASS